VQATENWDKVESLWNGKIKMYIIRNFIIIIIIIIINFGVGVLHVF
jgi:hypothetical protein